MSSVLRAPPVATLHSQGHQLCLNELGKDAQQHPSHAAKCRPSCTYFSRSCLLPLLSSCRRLSRAPSPFNPSAGSGAGRSTCKHRTKIRAAGRKDHAVGFHLHGFSHNHHVTEEPLAGKTPEKTKIISELLVRKKTKHYIGKAPKK